MYRRWESKMLWTINSLRTQTQIYTHIHILLPDVCGVVWIGSISVHPLNGIISPFHVEGVVVVPHPVLHPLVKELLGDHMLVTHQTVVVNCREGEMVRMMRGEVVCCAMLNGGKMGRTIIYSL